MSLSMNPHFYYIQLEKLATQQDQLSPSPRVSPPLPSQDSHTPSEDGVLSVPDQTCRGEIDHDHSFLKYAVKLGYELALAQDALARLGGSASTDALLKAVLYSYATLNPIRDWTRKHRIKHVDSKHGTSQLGSNYGFQRNSYQNNGYHSNSHPGTGYRTFGNHGYHNGSWATSDEKRSPAYSCHIINDHHYETATLQSAPVLVSTLPQQRRAISPPSSATSKIIS